MKIETLYNSIVRPALEYASITWNPWLIKDIEALEKVQTRDSVKGCAGRN